MGDIATGVFINCPFDDNYAPLFEAIVFAVHDCGFKPHCALEIEDGGQVRLEKILETIEHCRLGIHDISRTELDPSSGLPRFNMPFELGLFLGAKRFGSRSQRKKVCLILDSERYRYQKFCSDIAGQDIQAHDGDIPKAVRGVRNWLRNASAQDATVMIPSGQRIFERYELFLRDLPTLCERAQLDRNDLIYNDFTALAVGWLNANPW
jgi:hypothetical protein